MSYRIEIGRSHHRDGADECGATARMVRRAVPGRIPLPWIVISKRPGAPA